jgi:hypothetical protein
MPASGGSSPSADVGEVVDLVKTYATQQTVGPLKTMGRWIGFGVAGVLALSFGIIIVLVGILRLLQTEVSAFQDNWSWVPYVITLAIAVIVIAVALSRVKKLDFDRQEKP